MYKRIAHLDADCFYVSCERVRRSFLCGQPVGVLGNQGACVIARSYEMKAHGVPVGMPIWEARRLCPEGIFVKRDFEWYEVLSRQILDRVRRYSPAVEYYSIDEVFFDAQAISDREIRSLQQQLKEETGVPVSVGVSLSKTLAKLASGSGKPFGCVFAMEEDERNRLLHGRPVDKITGIAQRSRRKLEAFGICTCEDFVRADRRLIRRLLTKRGEELWWELNGVSVWPIHTTRVPHKYLSRGGSLGAATADPERLSAWVARNTERLIEALDYHGLYCERLAMSLRFKTGGGALHGVNLPAATADFRTLYAAGKELLAACWKPGITVAYMHLIAEKLTCREHAQRSLLAESEPRQQVLDHLRAAINRQVGRWAVRSGATLPLKDIYDDPANAYEICDIYGKSCF